MAKAPAVPLWWTKLKQPQAHERLVGSIEFYRRKWEGGAHWASSEDKAASGGGGGSHNPGNSTQGIAAAARPRQTQKDWPGYQAASAWDGYTTRFQQCKANRAAFETSSQKGAVASAAGKAAAIRQRADQLAAEVHRHEAAVTRNFWERDAARVVNKTIATEASSRLIKPRTGSVKERLPARQAGGPRPDWYGRRNTRPW